MPVHPSRGVLEHAPAERHVTIRFKAIPIRRQMRRHQTLFLPGAPKQGRGAEKEATCDVILIVLMGSPGP